MLRQPGVTTPAKKTPVGSLILDAHRIPNTKSLSFPHSPASTASCTAPGSPGDHPSDGFAQGGWIVSYTNKPCDVIGDVILRSFELP